MITNPYNDKADVTTGMGESNHLNCIIKNITYAQFKLPKPKSAGGASILSKN
jgi:hypothetical protein